MDTSEGEGGGKKLAKKPVKLLRYLNVLQCLLLQLLLLQLKQFICGLSPTQCARMSYALGLAVGCSLRACPHHEHDEQMGKACADIVLSRRETVSHIFCRVSIEGGGLLQFSRSLTAVHRVGF